MKSKPEDLQALRKITVRENVGPIFSAATIIRMVYEATAHCAWTRTSRTESEAAPEAVLRSVVTYCYAIGIFSSSDIEAAAAHDPAVRYLCANHEPDWQTVREFRRRNMPGLKLALARLFALALQEDQSTHHEHEAVQRLARAIQADSYALDV